MKNLNAQELLARTKNLVAQERKLTVLLIEHLEEIQRRMLYAEMGYASLWEFATQELGLSEGDLMEICVEIGAPLRGWCKSSSSIEKVG